jgi:hypothetical protein
MINKSEDDKDDSELVTKIPVPTEENDEPLPAENTGGGGGVDE